MNPERAFADEHIGLDGRYLRDDQMSILFSRIIARVQYFQTGDLDHKHRGAKDMAGMIGGKADTTGHDYLLVVVDCNDRLPRRLNFSFVKQTAR